MQLKHGKHEIDGPLAVLTMEGVMAVLETSGEICAGK